MRGRTLPQEAHMRWKFTFVVGVGLGYVLGSRAGRERYEQIRAKVQDLQESPTVQSAAGVLQQQASDLLDSARGHASGQI
jgi:hypothetical protein